MVKELSSETFWGHAGATARWHGVPTHRDTFCIPHTLHFVRVLCAGRTMPTPKPVQEPLAPGNRLPHVTKGTLPIWLRLEMGRVSGLPGWTLNAITSILTKRRQRCWLQRQEKRAIWPGPQRMEWCRYSQRMLTAMGVKNKLSPLQLEGTYAPINTEILAWWYWFWISGLQNCERKSLLF